MFRVQAAAATLLSQQISDVEALAVVLLATESASSAKVEAAAAAEIAAQQFEATRTGAAEALQQLERDITALVGAQPHGGTSAGGTGKGGRGSKR